MRREVSFILVVAWLGTACASSPAGDRVAARDAACPLSVCSYPRGPEFARWDVSSAISEGARSVIQPFAWPRITHLAFESDLRRSPGALQHATYLALEERQ